jgi:hypothetical protein
MDQDVHTVHTKGMNTRMMTVNVNSVDRRLTGAVAHTVLQVNTATVTVAVSASGVDLRQLVADVAIVPTRRTRGSNFYCSFCYWLTSVTNSAPKLFHFCTSAQTIPHENHFPLPDVLSTDSLIGLHLKSHLLAV